MHFYSPTSGGRAETWDEVKLSENDDPLLDAYDEARKRPLFPPESVSHGFSLFISVVGHLQRRFPGRPETISVAAFGRLLGCHRNTISLYKKHAKKLNLLTLKKQPSYEEGVASEYHFPIDQWDWHSGHYLGAHSGGGSVAYQGHSH